MGIVYESNNRAEMAIIESVLGSSGIEYVALDNLYMKGVLWFQISVPDEKDEEARALIEDYLKTISGEDAPQESVKPKPIICPECNSKDCTQTFLSMFTRTPKYKCTSCGFKFR